MHVGLCLRLVTTFGSVADIDSHEGGRGGRVVAQGEVRDIHDLLGRLHNQKRFYRPKHGVYVGG